MTCRRIGGAIVCSRARRPRPATGKPLCRAPDCDRRATQASWGCRTHWFRLPPDLRNRIWLADRDHPGSAAWRAAAEEGDRWLAEHGLGSAHASRHWRQPELPL